MNYSYLKAHEKLSPLFVLVGQKSWTSRSTSKYVLGEQGVLGVGVFVRTVTAETESSRVSLAVSLSRCLAVWLSLAVPLSLAVSLSRCHSLSRCLAVLSN